VRSSCRLPATRGVARSAAIVAFQALTEETWPGRIRLRRGFGVECILAKRPARFPVNRRNHFWGPGRGKRWLAPGRGSDGRVRRGTGCIGGPGAINSSSTPGATGPDPSPSTTHGPTSPGPSSAPDLSGAPGPRRALPITCVPGPGGGLTYGSALTRANLRPATPGARRFESFVLS
jgi:hypothetical protein